jgi:hypothetical protein
MNPTIKIVPVPSELKSEFLTTIFTKSIESNTGQTVTISTNNGVNTIILYLDSSKSTKILDDIHKSILVDYSEFIDSRLKIPDVNYDKTLLFNTEQDDFKLILTWDC